MINNMEKIIFLDIDGVLTNGAYVQTILKEHNNEEDTIKRHIMELDPTNIANINKIIAATNAKVVINTTIRDKANRYYQSFKLSKRWRNKKIFKRKSC